MYVADMPYGPDTNFVPQRNVYPDAGGGTLGTLASAGSPDTTMYAMDPSTGQSGNTVAAPSAPDMSPGGHPLTWWLGIGVLVAVIMIAARKTGNADEFSNLRASTYNVVLITAISILGITAAKIGAAKVKGVPGLSGLANVVIAA